MDEEPAWWISPSSTWSSLWTESCGEYPCGVGTKRLYEMLDKITKGQGTMEDLDKMEELCHYIQENSLCGLGQSYLVPLLFSVPMERNQSARSGE